jgi:hypothetical protein
VDLHRTARGLRHEPPVWSIEAVTYARIIFATRAGRDVLDELGIAQTKNLDLSATLLATTRLRDECQKAFESEQAIRIESKKLVPPEWPDFPSPLDIGNPARSKVSDAAGVPVAKTLATARWLSSLCTRWERLEEERLARPWLAKLDGNVERALPVVVA